MNRRIPQWAWGVSLVVVVFFASWSAAVSHTLHAVTNTLSTVVTILTTAPEIRGIR